MVAIKAAAVNYVDSLVVTGKYQFLPECPFAPGKLPAGEISALGTGVTGLEIGDRVLTFAEQGGYAEKVSVDARQCFELPPSMSFVDAASMSLVYDTSWFALRERARLREGESVLILGGTGGVGLAAIQLAKAMGAKVLAGVSTPAKAHLAREAGGDEVIDLSKPNLRDACANKFLLRMAAKESILCSIPLAVMLLMQRYAHLPGGGAWSSSALLLAAYPALRRITYWSRTSKLADSK